MKEGVAVWQKKDRTHRLMNHPQAPRPPGHPPAVIRRAGPRQAVIPPADHPPAAPARPAPPVPVDRARADASFSVARRSANSASKKSTPFPIAMCVCCRVLSRKAARSFLAVSPASAPRISVASRGPSNRHATLLCCHSRSVTSVPAAFVRHRTVLTFFGD